MPAAVPGGAIPATLLRRLAALAYEALLLAALWLIAALPLAMLTEGLDRAAARPLLQAWLLTLTGGYFTWQWRHGRTLAMKTWRLRLLARNGAPLTWRAALTRYVAAVAGTVLIGVGFLWALVDPDGLFLHDRLAGTVVVRSMSDE